MDNEIKKDLASNWFKLLQNAICDDISKLEIIEPCGFHLNDKRFKRVVMDYMDWDKVEIYQSSDKFFDAKKNHRVILMTTKSSVSYLKFKFEKDDTILFGRESAGVPEKIHQSTNDRLKIPMNENTRSLNIASSVAIILAESLRQTKLI